MAGDLEPFLFGLQIRQRPSILYRVQSMQWRWLNDENVWRSLRLQVQHTSYTSTDGCIYIIAFNYTGRQVLILLACHEISENYANLTKKKNDRKTRDKLKTKPKKYLKTMDWVDDAEIFDYYMFLYIQNYLQKHLNMEISYSKHTRRMRFYLTCCLYNTKIYHSKRALQAIIKPTFVCRDAYFYNIQDQGNSLQTQRKYPKRGKKNVCIHYKTQKRSLCNNTISY